MTQYKTGNQALDEWAKFFKGKKNNTRFIYLLKKIDKYFLTISPPQVIGELEFPENGLLEDSFRSIAFHDDIDNNDNKNKIVLAIDNNVNLKPWMIKYNEKFVEVIEKSFIEGDYEKYGIDFENVLVKAIAKEYIQKEDFMGIALLRGILWGSRYDSVLKEEQLKKQIKRNKIKLFFGL